MAFIDWADSYSVNVAEMDKQHQQLVSLINELHRAMMAARVESTLETVADEVASMGKTLQELIDYTSYHFATEES